MAGSHWWGLRSQNTAAQAQGADIQGYHPTSSFVCQWILASTMYVPWVRPPGRTSKRSLDVVTQDMIANELITKDIKDRAK